MSQKWLRIFGAVIVAAAGSYLIIALGSQTPTWEIHASTYKVMAAGLQRRVTNSKYTRNVLFPKLKISDQDLGRQTMLSGAARSKQKQRAPDAYNKLSIGSQDSMSVTYNKGVLETNLQPTGSISAVDSNQNSTAANTQSELNTNDSHSVAGNKSRGIEIGKVTPKQRIKSSTSPSHLPIYAFIDIESRFAEAKKRIKTISSSVLARIGYPGVSVHRRKWQYLVSIPDCTAEVENFVILVPTSPKNFEERNVVRSTWGNSTDMKKLKSKLVFVVGLTRDTEIQKRLIGESTRLKDIVQVDIYDAYYNLTLKTVGMLTWASQHCKTPKYVAKIDDDNLVKLPKILNILDNYHNRYEKFIAGNYRKGTIPSRRGKWADPVYRPVYNIGRKYPTFLAGPAYFLTNNFIGQLVNKCAELPLIHLEDVFVTGICGDQLEDLKKLSIGGMYMSRQDECKFLQSNTSVVHDYPVQALKPVWIKWQSNATCEKVTFRPNDF